MDLRLFYSSTISPSQKYYTKIIGGYQLVIYVGMWSVLNSSPLDSDLDINSYFSVGVEILDSRGVLLTDKHASNLSLDKLGLIPAYKNYSSYQNVSISKVEAIWIILENEAKSANITHNHVLSNINRHSEAITDQVRSIKQESKIGGKCSICGSYDDWASWENNKCFCYKHTSGY